MNRRQRIRNLTDRDLFHNWADAWADGMTAETDERAIDSFIRADRLMYEIAKRGLFPAWKCTCQVCMDLIADWHNAYDEG